MTARELGRRAAFLYIKSAAPEAVAGGGTAGATGGTTGGAASATTMGARTPTAAPPPATPNVAPAPAATRMAASPTASTPPPAPASGIGGMFGNMATPQGLGGMLANPALKNIVNPALQMGGFPLLAAGTNAMLHGGQDWGNIMKGPAGGGKPGAV